jgi:acyl-CoA thioesterase-2
MPGTFDDLLDLEEIDRDIYRAGFRRPEGRSHLYGGQVAAQALKAAGLTVPDGRWPHSLHGYFLRAGDAARPTVYRVERDRDGRSFSARRVVALQGGEVLFNMACSFHVPEDGYAEQTLAPLELAPPEELPPYAHGLVSVDMRAPAEPQNGWAWATRFWVRITEPLGDDALTHACALAYVSDISTGLVAFADATRGPGASIDHTVYFHRSLRADDWVLMDVVPHIVAHGRGVYLGSMSDATGCHAVSVVQEGLFRPIAHPIPAGRHAAG